MARKNEKPEVNTKINNKTKAAKGNDAVQKVQTNYDRRMERRRQKEIKDKRNAKIMRFCTIAIAAVIVVAIMASIVVYVMNRRAIVKDAYITVGNHSVSKLEYDYYYNSAVNNYLKTYGSLLSYMGLDPNTDLAEQQYSEELTWKDEFDRMTIEQIRRTKSLVADAAANNFVYDDTEKYQETLSAADSGAKTENMSTADYYKTAYGAYATKRNIAPFIKENILASAYYNDLIDKNTPEDQEIKDYYAEHIQEYDKVDYRNFIIAANIAEGADEEAISQAMTEAKAKADAMMAARLDGADFKALCLENATEENKATYEDAETDASLIEGSYYSGIPAAISQWLYEDGRVDGDIAVMEDETNHQYYVVEFINRYYDEADNEKISSTIAGDRVEEYINKLMESYPVTDNKGEITYLTVEEPE